MNQTPSSQWPPEAGWTIWIKGDEYHMPSGHLGVGREATPQEAESLRLKGWEPVKVVPQHQGEWPEAVEALAKSLWEAEADSLDASGDHPMKAERWNELGDGERGEVLKIAKQHLEAPSPFLGQGRGELDLTKVEQAIWREYLTEHDAEADPECWPEWLIGAALAVVDLDEAPHPAPLSEQDREMLRMAAAIIVGARGPLSEHARYVRDLAERGGS